MVAVLRIEPVKRAATPGSRPYGPSAAFFPSTPIFLKRHTRKSIAHLASRLSALCSSILCIPLLHFLIRMPDPVLQVGCGHTCTQMKRCPSPPEFMERPFVSNWVRRARRAFF